MSTWHAPMAKRNVGSSLLSGWRRISDWTNAGCGRPKRSSGSMKWRSAMPGTHPQPHHLRWLDLDIDLAVDSIRHPERFPLIPRQAT
jgi:hypothetical protein